MKRVDLLPTVAISVLMLCLAACRPSAPPTPAPDPPVPESWDGIEPQVQATIEQALAIVREQPDNAIAWWELAMVYHANDLIDLAEPGYLRALQLGESDPHVSFYLARVRSELGNVDGAIEAIETASEGDEPAWFLYWRRGFWLLEQGRLDEAQAAFAKAAELEPRDPTSYVGLARVALQQDRLDEAAEILGRTLRENPGMSNADYARHLLGTAYQRLGRTEEAEPLLAAQPARSLSWPDPWSDELYDRYRREAEWIIHKANRLIRAGRVGDALVELEGLRAFRGDDPTLLKMLGMAYFAKGDLPAAIEAMTEVAKQDPQDFSAALNLAHALERSEQWSEAAVYAAQACQLRPESPEAALQHVRVLLEGGEPAQAVTVLETFVASQPPLPSAYVWLAIARAETGDAEGASAALEQARLLNPNDPDLPAATVRIEAALGGGGASQ